MAAIVNKVYYLKSAPLWFYWWVNPVKQQHRIPRDLPSLVLEEDHDHASELIEQVTSLPQLPTRASYCEGADTPKNKNRTFTYIARSVHYFYLRAHERVVSGYAHLKYVGRSVQSRYTNQ